MFTRKPARGAISLLASGAMLTGLLFMVSACSKPMAKAMETTYVTPPPAGDVTMAKATFGAGCFWGVEYIFRQVAGVTDVACGYAGGKTNNPSYKQVCYDDTGHAEVVEVTYDPAKVSYEALVKVFFECHDPTTPDRQGPDIGDQYRSVIFYHDEAQKATAEKVIAEATAKKLFPNPIVTEVSSAPAFWRAEEYHQQYYAHKGSQPYCHFRRKLF